LFRPVSRAAVVLVSVLALLAIKKGAARNAGPELLTLEGDLEGVHDPAIIRQGSTYYVFVTNGTPGNLIPIRCSPDLQHWMLCGHVFDKLPDWAAKEIPRARAPWAPDISFYRGKYRLYYAVSSGLLGRAFLANLGGLPGLPTFFRVSRLTLAMVFIGSDLMRSPEPAL
jgi:beta-xylosidase